MKGSSLLHNEYATSEVVGSIILVLVAVMVFSVIYLDVTSKDIDIYETNVLIVGSVNDEGLIVLKHMSGDEIKSYTVNVYDEDDDFIGSKIYDETWVIGESKYPLDGITDIKLVDETVSLFITVYTENENGGSQEIFSGTLSGKVDTVATGLPPGNPTYDPSFPLLISSLRDDTIDEDLICFNFSENISVTPSTFIYNWIKNGNPLTEFLFSFDTQSSDVVKDYTGNGYNATINGANWTNTGVVGGAYYFKGSGDYITTTLPDVLNDIENNDFTVSLWLKTEDVQLDNPVAVHASKDNKNFIKIFQFGNQFHVGICYDGTKDAVRTEELSNNVWYYVVACWDASEKTISLYLNGEECIEIGNRNFALGAGTGFELGHGSASSRFWLGYMDEVEFYNFILSQDQINQNYICKKDGLFDKSIIVSTETSLGDNWQCIVTPNDGTMDGDPGVSNTLQIVAYPGGE